MKRKRILVTGGAGFIGSHLCKRLLDDNNNVLCVDNFFTGSKDNILELMKNERFELLRHDITFPLYVEVDEIYNLACPASPTYYQLDPVQTIKTSVHGSINMLGLAKRTNAKILQASTSEVYGDPEVNSQKESYWGRVNPIGPRSCYDEGKRCAESLFFNYYKQHKIDIKIVRVFNTYGPSMASGDGRVVSNFISMIITIFLYLGAMRIALYAYDNKEFKFADLFSQQSVLLSAVGAMLLSTLFIGIGFIALIIPGIWIFCRLYFAEMIIVDKKIGTLDALKESWRITKGRSLKIFGMFFVVIGINILGALALGVGLLISIPITTLTITHIYRRLLEIDKSKEKEVEKEQKKKEEQKQNS